MTNTETSQILKKFLTVLKKQFIRKRIYFAAFAIPAAIMYTAYAIFGVYPFGERSVLVLDLSGQYVYYFEALKDALTHSGISAVYSWARNLSGGFAGVIAYYLASPFTIIVMLLPRTMMLGSLLIMQLAKLGTAGMTFCYYLRKSKKIPELHSIIFSVLYALSAYGIIQLMNPMWLDGMILLPLITLGIEYIADDGRKLNFIIPLAVMLISNFYIGYMICIFSAVYYTVYVLLLSRKKPGEIFKSFIRIAVSAMTAVMCAAFVLLPVYNALKLGKFDFSEPDHSYKTQFSFGDLFAQLMVGQYDAMTPDGQPEIYCGIFTAVLLPLFFLNRKINNFKKTGYGILTAVITASMYIRPVDMIWHGFQMPNWMPFRYSFILSFLLLSMAAETFKNLKGIKLFSIGASLSVTMIFLLVTLSRVREGDITVLMNNSIPDIAQKDVWISIVLAAVYTAILFIMRKTMKKNRIFSVIMPSVIIAAVCGELLYNCADTLKSEDKDLTYPTHSSWYNYINNGREITNTLYEYDTGFYRSEKTFHRTANDNAAWGLRGVSHSNSVMNAGILEFLKSVGYAAGKYYSRYDGATPITDSILGIKYVMDKNMDKNKGTNMYRRYADPAYKPVFKYEYTDENNEECVVDVYKNPYALSIGFMADKNILNIGKLENGNALQNQNILMNAISGETVTNHFNEYFKRIDADPDKFILNNVTLSPYGNHKMYTAGKGDPTVDMHITVPSEKPIYLFFNSENAVPVNLWLSHEQDENGGYINFSMVNTYFDVYSHCVMCLGSFKTGEIIDLRMTVTHDLTIVKDFLFYEFDEQLFAESVHPLKEHQWELTEAGGRTLEGTINAPNGKIMLTSIPYEPGWSVTVDGKKTEHKKVLQSLIGIELTPGIHTVKMTYTPPGLNTGILLFFSGTVLTILIYRYDKKHGVYKSVSV